MTKLEAFHNNDGEIEGYLFKCPACPDNHAFWVRPHKAPNGASWDFDGNMDNPTFSPSLISRVTPSPESGRPQRICHFFLKNGVFEFLGDCTHDKRGQSIPFNQGD